MKETVGEGVKLYEEVCRMLDLYRTIKLRFALLCYKSPKRLCKCPFIEKRFLIFSFFFYQTSKSHFITGIEQSHRTMHHGQARFFTFSFSLGELFRA